MTGWKRLDRAVTWVDQHPEAFFLACFGVYLLICSWGF